MSAVKVLSNWINNLTDIYAKFAFSSIELDEIFDGRDLVGKEEQTLWDLLLPIWKRYLKDKNEKSPKVEEIVMTSVKTSNMFDLLSQSHDVACESHDVACESHDCDDAIQPQKLVDLAKLPANKGIVFDGSKFYGIQDVCDDGMSVELADPDTGVLHRWYRRGHTLFRQVEDRKEYLGSEQMDPCPNEQKFGYCSQRFDPTHKKFAFHFCRHPAKFVGDKPVCRYSLTDKNHLCWEKNNALHVKAFHHYD